MKYIFIKTAFIVILVLVFNSLLKAQTWTGAVSTAWNNAANWSPASIPAYNTNVTIPGTGITNWPVLSSNINVSYLSIGTGGEIDTKGFEIRIGQFMFNENCVLGGAHIKNSASNTTSRFVIVGTSNIGHTTFDGNVEFTFGAYFQDRFNYSTFFEYANHFKGNVKFNASGNSEFYISNELTTFDADVEINFDSYKPIDGNSQAFPAAYLFSGGSTISGNLKINSPGVADTYLGQTLATTVSGSAEVTQGGELSVANAFTIAGTSLLKMVGGVTNRIYQNNPVSFAFRNITIDKIGSAQVTLAQSLRLAGNLSFVNGNIQNAPSSGANGMITFLDGATTSGASDASHLVIPAQKIGDEAFTFPIGSATKLFNVKISAPSNVTDNFSAAFVTSSPTSSGYDITSKAGTLSKVYADGFWDIKPVNGNSSVYLTLGYELQNGYITDQSNLRVAHWDGTKWQNLGNGGTTGNVNVGSVITASPVSSFSPFTLASSDASNPLPVKLIAFTVRRENETVLFQWRTSEEENSDRFEIERSQDATTWAKIGEVKALENSQVSTSYSFVDRLPIPGLSYYRLKMLDNDGSHAYTKIERLDFLIPSAVVLYPNPVSEKLYIRTSNGNNASKVELYNLVGKKVSVTKGQAINSGIDLSNISAGIYVVNITFINGEVEKHKVTVNR